MRVPAHVTMNMLRMPCSVSPNTILATHMWGGRVYLNCPDWPVQLPGAIAPGMGSNSRCDCNISAHSGATERSKVPIHCAPLSWPVTSHATMKQMLASAPVPPVVEHYGPDRLGVSLELASHCGMLNHVLWLQYLDSRRACILFLLLRRLSSEDFVNETHTRFGLYLD